jgi:hypothetical protein
MSGELESSPLSRLAAGVESLRVSHDRLEHSITHLRHLRVAGVLGLMLIGAILGAAGVVGAFFHSYQSRARAAAFVDKVYDEGISLSSRQAEDGFHLMLNGPITQAKRFKDENGNANGVELVFPNQDRR